MAKRILVVEDHSDIVMALEEMFKAWGFEVETAVNGVEAIELLQGTPVDGMILGIIMPQMNGFEVVRYLRENGSKIPVIVYSAIASVLHQNNPQDAYLMSNVQALLTKPVSRDELKAAVDRCFGPP